MSKGSNMLRKLMVLMTLVGLLMGTLNTVAFAAVNTKSKTPVSNVQIKGQDGDANAVPNAKINLTSTTNPNQSYLLTSGDDGLFDTIIDNATGLTTATVTPGKYTVSTVNNPTGFRLVDEGLIIEVTSRSQNEFTLYYEDAPASQITLNARQEDGTGLAGVIFTATDTVSQTVYPFTATDNDGYTRLKLPVGQYQIGIQTLPDAQYQPAAGLPVIQLGNWMNHDEDIYFTKQSGQLQVAVKDSATQKGLAGVKVSAALTQQPDQKIMATTDANGQATWASLAEGEYRVAIETMAPGYLGDGVSEQIEKVYNNQKTLVTFHASHQTGSLQIKSISESGQMIPNVTYQVAGIDGQQVQTVQTDRTGQVSVGQLNEGQYRITETKIPTGYKLQAATQTITIRNGQVQTATFDHQIERSDAQHDLVLKTANLLGDRLGGVQFQVKLLDSPETFDQMVITDAAGVIRLANVPLGKYQITQMSTPVGYQSDTVQQTVLVTNERANEYQWTFNRAVSDVGFTVTDQATGQPLAGATFLIKTANPDDHGQQTFLSAETDQLGNINVAHLPVGAFTYQQVTAATGYAVDQTVYSGEIQADSSGDNHFKVTNKLAAVNAKSRITVRKNNAQGQPLDQAQFKLMRVDGGNVQIKTTINGQLAFDELTTGRYVVQETKAPAGYALDQTQQFVDVDTKERINQVVTFVDQRETVDATHPLTISAVDDQGKAIAGAVFKLTVDLADDQGATEWHVTTDANGLAVLPKAVVGQYRVQMIKAPSGYQQNDAVYQMSVAQYSDNHLNVVSESIMAPEHTLQINKTDLQGQRLAGAVFAVKDLQTGQETAIETDQNGQAQLPHLTTGLYEVTETKAPTGYRLDDQVHKLTVTKDDAPVIEMAIKDAPQVGQLTIKKLNIGRQLLAGAVFDVHNRQGQLMGNYETDSKGRIMLVDLPVGEYTVQEVKAPAGYQINPDTFKVTIEDQKTATLTVVDQALTPDVAPETLLIKNIDQQKKTPLVGATFRLETKTGEVVRAQIVVGVTGEVVVPDIKAGKYQLVQTTAATAYQRQKKPISVKILGNHETTAISVDNQQQHGSVIVNQVDGNTGHALVGAKYQLRTKDGQILINNLKSNDRGQVIIDHLDPASYELIQVKATKGYDTIKKPISFKITADGAARVTK